MVDTTRKYLELTCSHCGDSYQQQERVYKKARWKDRCPKCRGAKPTCERCGAPIWKGSTHCKKCSNRDRLAAQGFTFREDRPTRYCSHCGVELKGKTSTLCLPCHNKNQDKGLSRVRTKFNASPKWAQARVACFTRDDYTCQHCKVRGGELNAHHIKPYSTHPDLRLDVANLMTLCVLCHHQLHHPTLSIDTQKAIYEPPENHIHPLFSYPRGDVL